MNYIRIAKKGAHETILYGVLGLHISIDNIDAEFMENNHPTTLATYFNIPIDREEQVMMGMYVT